MSYSEKVLATAATREEARAIALTLPRPTFVHKNASGEWVVAQLLPAKWAPAAVHNVTS